MARCGRCHKEKPVSEFYLRTEGRREGKPLSYCKACYQTYNAPRNKAKYDANKALIDVAKDVPCADCGERYAPYVMDFDHRNPENKEFGIACSISGVSPSRLKAEIKKCDVVCANCHRERTHGTQGGEAVPVVASSAALALTA